MSQVSGLPGAVEGGWWCLWCGRCVVVVLLILKVGTAEAGVVAAVLGVLVGLYGGLKGCWPSIFGLYVGILAHRFLAPEKHVTFSEINTLCCHKFLFLNRSELENF